MRKLALLLAAVGALAAQDRKAANAVLVTADGLRWQEVFRGIDPLLMNEKEAGMKDAGELRQKLWATTPEQRRERLLPFFWKTIARQGVMLGNLDKGSAVKVTNSFRVSYPGYSEILTCRAQDEAIRGNDPIRNPRRAVLEYAREKLSLDRSQVTLFGSWSIFRFIGESREGAIFLNAGYQDAGETPRLQELSRMQHEALSPWDSVRHDYVTFEMALDYLKRFKPRVLYIALGETDDWAHTKRYDRVLQTAQYFDRSMERLWDTLQAMDEYRGRTALLVTSDHGRGSQLSDWFDHGAKVAGAEYIWMAAMGPGVTARGELANAPPAFQRDASATLLQLLGLDWQDFCGDAGKPVGLIVGP